MTETLTDPRTESVKQSADDVEHAFCEGCWYVGQPMLCGEPDYDGTVCPDDCGHPKCPMCELAWQTHECDVGYVLIDEWRYAS